MSEQAVPCVELSQAVINTQHNMANKKDSVPCGDKTGKKMIAPDIGSTNTGSVTNVSETVNERAPLLSQRRLFRSLSGCPTLITSGPETGRTLGTFAGVFSPVALSMFSALLFLRVGFIVGNAGLLVTLLQFTIAYGILLFTVASVCAISTNGAVEGGGAYFMISRTLGPEFGGSIGSLFFLANVVSSALYITGCTEGLVENFGPSGYLVGENNTILPDGRWWRFLYCSVLNLLNLVVCLIGANMFAKTSVAILAIVCVCLMSTIVSFFTQGFEEIRIPDANEIARNTSGNYTGLSSVTLQDNLYPQYGLDYTVDEEHVHFAAVFGVLFSGVTGIMAGANMSGELRDPAKNIPRGTLSAVAFTFVCYIIVSLLTAASCSRYLLQNNFIFLMPINLWPGFVTIGILTATFSASLSNLIGSSRVLEALAKDDVFGYLLHFIVRGTRRGNPIAAVFVSWFLVELILIIGSLNVIAQINSVLFLLSYLATNLACLGLELASAPNFRPSFKYFTWHTALIGLVGTFVMMFIINTIYASSSIILCLILIIVLHVFSPTRGANWGSISQALIFHQVRKYLLLLDSRKDHVKFWRPQMLLMVVNPRSSCPLIDFVNDMKKGGLYVLGHVKVGNFLDSESDPTMEEYPHWLALVDHLKVKAFVELTMAKSVREGLHHLIRISGLGAMKPNTIVLGFYDDKKPVDFFEKESCFQTRNFRTFQSSGSQVYLLREEEEDKCLEASDYVAMVNDVLKMQKNICLCRHFNLLDKSMVKNRSKKYIDVWPINFFNPNDTDPFDTTSLFMLQLACIINMVPSWKSLRMRVFMCAVSMQTDVKKSEVRLEQLLQLLRIAADIHQVQWEDILTLWECEPEEVKTESNVHTIHYNIPALYLQRVNELIQQHSSNTAVTFIYLPHPPVSFEDEAPMYLQYLEHLTEITENLPPTVLVHGVSPVTSTTL